VPLFAGAIKFFVLFLKKTPTPNVPAGLKAVAAAGGKVRLTWRPVQEAVGYRLYRQGPDDTEPAALVRVQTDVDPKNPGYEDTTGEDGDYVFFEYQNLKILSQKRYFRCFLNVVSIQDNTKMLGTNVHDLP